MHVWVSGPTKMPTALDVRRSDVTPAKYEMPAFYRMPDVFRRNPPLKSKEFLQGSGGLGLGLKFINFFINLYSFMCLYPNEFNGLNYLETLLQSGTSV
ncbi:hypothetical protein TNCV_3045111 [Trichonephila clavipes]|nr:hypothetical protein TNCV_3045061 [Trichonephila clavipes]GFV78132.1 hypothetical protein TNCV_3045111 [Trichonephila clavipes]